MDVIFRDQQFGHFVAAFMSPSYGNGVSGEGGLIGLGFLANKGPGIPLGCRDGFGAILGALERTGLGRLGAGGLVGYGGRRKGTGERIGGWDQDGSAVRVEGGVLAAFGRRHDIEGGP